MRVNSLLLMGISIVLWACGGVAQEPASQTAANDGKSGQTVGEVEPTAPSAVPSQADAPIRLGTIQVTPPRDHASHLSNPFGTILPPGQQTATSVGQGEPVRWGNLTHSAGATYGSAVRIGQPDFERKTALNITDALKGESGVRVNFTGRRANEGTISIRGSSRYQVGMYIDDIPVGTAYRNEWDASNYLLYNLDSIEVSKGFSSPLLATNNGLAGVVNLRTAKPTEKFEGSVRYLNSFDRDFGDQGRMVATNVGTRQEKFYFKASAILDEQDYIKLPGSFTPGLYQDRGRRNDFNSRNRSLNLIAGLTPNDRVDVMFGFTRQLYKKGHIVNAAQDFYRNGANPDEINLARNNNRFIFAFPDYETTRYYMNANVQLTDALHMKAVAYYDEHYDRSVTIDSRTGKPVIGNRNWVVSAFDQYTYGGHVRFDYVYSDMHQLSASTGYRRLSHKKIDDYGKSQVPPYRNGLMTDKIVEDYLDFGGEYTFRPIEPLAFVLGGSYSWVKPDALLRTPDVRNQPGVYESYKRGMLGRSNTLTTWQAGVFYDITENHQVYGTFAKKSRFATMRERYNLINMRDGITVDPEHATHVEIGYRGLFDEWLRIDVSAYYSKIKDYIRNNGQNTPFENTGECKLLGFEVNTEAVFSEWLRIGANLNLVKWTTASDVLQHRTDYKNVVNLPNISSTIYAVYQPIEKVSIIPQVEMSGSFYRDAKAVRNYYSKSPGFVVADLKVVYDINKHVTVEAGAKNIFDKEYAYSSYFPQQGRSFFLGVTANW